jgi:diguanylate cyclase (GGDEF)-like protein/PAS domain S-box-containing protein
VTGPEGALEGQILSFPNSDDVLRSILEHASVGMSLVDMQGRVVYANRAFSVMFGHPPADCIGLRAADLVEDDFTEAAEAQLAQLMRGEIDSYRSERRYRRRDGSLFWGVVSASAVNANGSGRPLYLIVQIADVDREKAAIAALAESESRWNFALDSAGQGVWDHDLRTGRVFYSARWKLLRGFDPGEEVDPASWLSRVHPDDRERITAIVRRQDSGELAYNEFEYRERHRDGHWVWILSRGKPVEWMPDGSVARIMGTDTDISHLKEIEERLAAEREWLAVTLDSIADGVIATDPRHRITLLNPAAEQLTGWTRERALGRPLAEVFDVRDEASRAPMLAVLLPVLSGAGARVTREGSILVDAAGGECVIRECASPVRAANGAVIGGVLVFQDITDSHRARRDLAYAATHDPLTGLHNREAFERALRQASSEVRDGGRQHVLCFVDLDRFKLVNDSAGHVVGDAFLRLVAQTMSALCRAQDHCARIGGDEFAIILRDCGLEAGRAIAAKITGVIGDLVLERDGRSFSVGASIGVIVIDPAMSPTEHVAAADAECYREKRAKRAPGRRDAAPPAPRD